MNDKQHLKPVETTAVTVTPQAIAARFSSCGQFLVAGCFDGQLRRFQLGEDGNSLTPLAPMKGHGGWVEAFDHHPADPICYSGDSWGKLQAWTHTNEEPHLNWVIDEAHDGWIRALDVDSAGERIATCGLDRRVCVRSTADGRLIRQWQVPDAEVFSVRFHPQRDELACGDLLGRVHRWNLATGESLPPIDASDLYLLHRLQDVGGARVLRFDASGEQLAVGGTRPKNGATVQGAPTVFVFDYASGKRLHELKLGAPNHCFVHDVEFHPDGFLMIVTSGTPGSGQIILQTPGEDTAFFTHTKIANCHSISLHPNKQRFTVAATNRGSNGNGRRLNKDGEYEGNQSPIHVFQLERAAT